jgi:alkylation response protein AidB-like acyl-CoA dehydrogenase
MADNFFTDNPDMQFHLDRLDLREVVEIAEDGYRYSEKYPVAPRSYEDAKDNYRLLLTILGDICANQVAPRAGEAAEEGAHFEDGQVIFAPATLEGLELLRQAELMGAMLPWEYGGLNMPESIFQMMVEITSRAEAGLMTIFGLQEISAAINEYADEEVKARVLPRFARGEVTGAMVLTEPDAGSDLGVVQTRATYDEAADEWRLNGVKRFITNGSADVLLAQSLAHLRGAVR